MAESAPTSHREPGRIRASRSSQGALRAVPHGDVADHGAALVMTQGRSGGRLPGHGAVLGRGNVDAEELAVAMACTPIPISA